MAEFNEEYTDRYVPAENHTEITLQVEIGEGQTGTYDIYLGTAHISSDGMARLGKKADLQGKTTLVSVTITDLLKETNRTSMTVKVFEEGYLPVVYGPYKKEVPNHLDTVFYTLQLRHV